MAEIHAFKCGHTAELKAGLFGRGKTRCNRITEYFNRQCLHCAVDAVEPFVRTLTKIDGSPLPETIVESKVIERIKKLHSSYLMTVNS